MVSNKSPPGFTTAPVAPSAHPSMTMKNVTFQNNATLACTKARSSSLFSPLDGALRLSIQTLSTTAPSIARARLPLLRVHVRARVRLRAPVGAEIAAERGRTRHFAEASEDVVHPLSLPEHTH